MARCRRGCSWREIPSTRPAPRTARRRRPALAGGRAGQQSRQDSGIGVHPGGDVGHRNAGLARRLPRVPVIATAPSRTGSAGRTPSCRDRVPSCRIRRCRRRSARVPRRSCAASRARREAAPGARFWTNTSARSRSRPRRPGFGRFRSSVSDSLDRFSHTKWLDWPLTVVSYARAKVADSRPFDLDHPRAEVGQVPGGERSRHRLLQGHDGHALEWPH